MGFDGVDVALDSEKLLKKTTENNVFSKIYNRLVITPIELSQR